MNEAEYHALASIQFSSVLGPDEVWSPMRYHVDGLHSRAAQVITNAVQGAKARPDSTPTGLVLSGDAGVGKTHMLGWLRNYVQQEGGGCFFMPKLLDGQSFWTGAVHGIVTHLLDSDGGQLGRILDALIERTGCGAELRMRLRGRIPSSRGDLDEFIDRMAEFDAAVTFECRDTLRALILFQANAAQQREIGYSFLTMPDGIDNDDRAAWGFRSYARDPQLIFNDMLRLFALTGPTVLAIDQIDSVIARSGQADDTALANRLADGLMRMREETRRTLVVASCIPGSWELITTRAVNSVADRFTRLELSTAMPSAAVATAIVERHLGTLYGEAGFEPPYPTWPVLPKAFDDPEVTNFSPRRLLQLVEEHVRQCLAENVVRELTHFGKPSADSARPIALPTATELARWDDEFAELRASAEVVKPLDPEYEDDRMLSLLDAALRCYALEQGSGGNAFTVDPRTKVRPALHGRLRRTLDETTEDEEHWSFRAISHSHHSAVLSRLRSACLEAEIQPGSAKRHLVILRNAPFSRGAKTIAAIADMEAAQGIALPIEAEDLRTFGALEAMLADSRTTPGFGNWLEARQPATRSGLLSRVLGDSTATIATTRAAVLATDMNTPPSILLGRNIENGADFRILLAQLRKHTTLFAASGSGKTVFLKRLVESAALEGISSIVIDINNDLAQLGDRWPSPPDTWGRHDTDRAARYFTDTEVLVWTPRRETGRPLALNPLPDFDGVRDDRDEFRTAVEASVAGLILRSGLYGRKRATGNAVLIEALTYFADRGGNDLSEFVALLGNLPDEASTIRNS
ncbi:DUF87 domain-containing protein, partial [Nocardia terpenica]